MKYLIAVLGPVALLTGCAATTEWSRPDTTLEQRLADEKECQSIASYQAFDESFSSGPKYPPFTDTQFIQDGGPDGGGGLGISFSRRGPREYELADYCMRQRGYTLVPIKKP